MSKNLIITKERHDELVMAECKLRFLEKLCDELYVQLNKLEKNDDRREHKRSVGRPTQDTPSFDLLACDRKKD